MMAAPASPPPPAPPPPASIIAAEVSEQPTQVTFTAPYKVTVAAGQSLMLPLLDRDLPARRIGLFQPSVNTRHPLAAIEMTNDSGSLLPPGVVTLYRRDPDRGALHLGDARLAAFPSGDKRLLSYALDGKITIDSTTVPQQPIVKAAVAEGVMRIGRVMRWTTTYRVRSADPPPPPPLVFEHPRRAGAVLVSPDPKTVELTPRAYRIPVTLPASGDGSLTIIEEQPVEETIRLLDLDENRLGVLVSSSELDPAMRQVLADFAARRQQIARQRAELDRLQDRRTELIEDENRLRANLTAVGDEPSLRRQQLEKFAGIGSAIEKVSAAIAEASEAIAASERDLAAFIGSLRL